MSTSTGTRKRFQRCKSRDPTCPFCGQLRVPGCRKCPFRHFSLLSLFSCFSLRVRPTGGAVLHDRFSVVVFVFVSSVRPVVIPFWCAPGAPAGFRVFPPQRAVDPLLLSSLVAGVHRCCALHSIMPRQLLFALSVLLFDEKRHPPQQITGKNRVIKKAAEQQFCSKTILGRNAACDKEMCVSTAVVPAHFFLAYFWLGLVGLGVSSPVPAKSLSMASLLPRMRC